MTRINGQYFAYVAEQGDKGGLVARQRLVRLRPLAGADYTARGGLKAGDRLIVSGIQKVTDGVPVAAAAVVKPRAAGGRLRAAGGAALGRREAPAAIACLQAGGLPLLCSVQSDDPIR